MYDFIYVHIFALCQNRAAEWSGVVFRKVKNYGRKFNFMIFAHEYKHAIKYWKKLLLCVFFPPAHRSANKQFISPTDFNGIRQRGCEQSNGECWMLEPLITGKKYECALFCGETFFCVV